MLQKRDNSDKLIERAYHETCSGIQINMMDIPKVFDAGHKAINEGKDYEGMKAAIRAFVETIRKN